VRGIRRKDPSTANRKQAKRGRVAAGWQRLKLKHDTGEDIEKYRD